MKELTKKSLKEIVDGLERKDFSCRELILEYIKTTREIDGEIGGYITTNFDNALHLADKADQIRSRNSDHPLLLGVPFAVKDNICTKGIKTTCGSKILENFVSPYNATVIENLTSQGMIILGKTNMDEFGMGSMGENSAYRPTKNPLNQAYSPGGSSSGSAAVVASGQAPIALGSDTGGSVRLPASFCGLVGMKPTYGNLSRYGLVSFAPSLDQIGVISKTVYDNALLLQHAQGYDPKDATSLSIKRECYISDINQGVRGMKIALPTNLDSMDIGDEIKCSVYNTAKILEKLGCSVTTCTLPDSRELVSCYYILSCVEASSNLARFDGIRYGVRCDSCENTEQLYIKSRSCGFGSEVKKRIMLGSFALSSGYFDKYYQNALKIKNKISKQYQEILKECNAILTPTYQSSAKRLDHRQSSLESFISDMFTVGANISSLPSITIPTAKDGNKMPISVSFLGNHMAENILYRIANTVEGGIK